LPSQYIPGKGTATALSAQLLATPIRTTGKRAMSWRVNHPPSSCRAALSRVSNSCCRGNNPPVRLVRALGQPSHDQSRSERSHSQSSAARRKAEEQDIWPDLETTHQQTALACDRSGLAELNSCGTDRPCCVPSLPVSSSPASYHFRRCKSGPQWIHEIKHDG
jgi:hypothetical protein